MKTKFFGFYPQQLYTQIYAVGYNEFLKAVSILKDNLLQEFPEKEKEIEMSCSKMLDRYSQEFDKEWFHQFMVYCSKNIFAVQPTIPIYKPEMEAVEANRQAHTKLQNLRHCIMATEYLNAQLLGKLRELDAEITKRKDLLSRVIQTEQKLAYVKRAKELERHLETIEQPHEQ